MTFVIDANTNAAAVACSAQGMQSRLEHVRGWDHGVFIPLLAMLHDKRTPVLQLSLLSSLDPAAHLALGRALVPLRERGVLVVGSGLSYHNMRGFSLSSKARSGAAGSQERSHAFRDWLSDTVRKPGPERCAPDTARCMGPPAPARSACAGHCMCGTPYC